MLLKMGWGFGAIDSVFGTIIDCHIDRKIQAAK